MEVEIWKDIEGYEGFYQISNLGRTRSVDRIDSSGNRRKGRIRKPHFTKFGYALVNLCKEGKVKHFLVHRLVAIAFIPNSENKEQVNHIDGNKKNNRLDNLEWATRSENVLHALDTGLLNTRGVLNNKSKVNEIQVRKIRMLRETDPKKYTYKVLGKMFGISSVMAGDIVKRNHWKHVD